MTPYEKAYNETIGIEGLYSDDPDDLGGETYKGIARIKHPDWHGWTFIDEEKGHPGFPDLLAQNALIEQLVQDFYKAQFWNHVWGDRIVALSYDIAAELFDTAVNQGEHFAILYLQQALSLLNRNATLYPDLVEDGSLGEKTIFALTAFLKTDTPEMLLLWMNIFQGARYAALKQEKYIRGWAKRITITKEKRA
jgi:lysozyme family protein